MRGAGWMEGRRRVGSDGVIRPTCWSHRGTRELEICAMVRCFGSLVCLFAPGLDLM